MTEDKRKAECPYCHKVLDKIPGKKTKCRHCGEFMFVRTRPKDKARIVVTKEEAEEIESDWDVIFDAKPPSITEMESAKADYGKYDYSAQEAELSKKTFRTF